MQTYGKFLGEGDYTHAKLAEKLSQYFKFWGRYHTAVALAEEEVDFRAKAKAINHPNRLLAVENPEQVIHAQASRNLDVYKQMLPRWEQWYTTWEKSLSLNHELVQ